MCNPFLMVKADLKKNLVSSVGILLLLSLACSLQYTVTFTVKSLVESLSESASGYDLVIGAAGSRTDLVLSAVYLRTDNVLPLLDYGTYEEIAADERTALAIPLVFADSYEGNPVVGTEWGIAEILGFTLDSGAFDDGDFSAIAGSDTGLSVGDEFETAHTGAGDHEHHDYKVTGCLSYTGTPWDRAVLVKAESSWKIHSSEDKGVSAILVKPVDFASAYALRSEYREGESTAAFPAEVLATFFAIFQDVGELADLICFFISLIVLSAAIISLLVSLPSRYKEIGVLRALGASRFYIFFSIWFSSALIFLISGASGFLLGSLWSSLILSGISSFLAVKSTLVLSASDFIPLLIFCFIGMAGSLLPALKGFSVSPREVLLS